MASVSDGMSVRLSLDTNGHSDPFTVPNSTSNMRNNLQSLLDEKEKDLQLAGTIGHRILEQRVELEQRINALSEHQQRNHGARTPDSEGGDVEYQRQLDELAHTLQNWEIENEQLMGGFNKRMTGGPSSARPPQTPLTPSDSPARPQHDLPPEPEPDYSYDASVASGPSIAQSSRRAKNAAPREHDVKFAYDIGTSLLSEVRRLQSLLTERDRTIQDMKAERDDIEKENDSLRTSLRQQEASADKFKEENWNLEVQIQEIRTQFQDAQQAASRSESELRRATKQLTTIRETIETQKSENDRLTTTYEEFKTKHETDVAQMRRQAASLNRDKSDLQASLDALKAEMAKRERTVGRRFGSPMANANGPGEAMTPNNAANDEDFFATGGASRKRVEPSSAFLTPGTINGDYYGPDFDSSPDPSPSKPPIAPNHPSNELETLRQALAHAHRQIGTLKNTIQREKEQKLTYKKQLAKDGQLANVPGAWEDDEEEVEDEKPERQVSFGPRGRGRPLRGRAPKILNLAQKLGLASVGKRQSGEYEEVVSPTAPSTHRRSLLDEDVEGDEEPSPFVVKERPTSVDGMDPTFANVLKDNSSPMRPSPLGAVVKPSPDASPMPPPKKGRGGNAFVRPDSLVDPITTSLGAELGGTEATIPEEGSQPTSALLEEFEEENTTTTIPALAIPPKEYAEMNIQTEAEPEVVPPPVVAPEPIMIPAPLPPKVETAEFSMQTEAEPRATYAESFVATDPIPVVQPKSLVDMDIQTDEIPDVQEVEIQTVPVQTPMDVEIRSLVISREEVERPDAVVPFPIRTALEAAELSHDEDASPVPARTPRILSMASVRTARPHGMIFEDVDEEHPIETETEAEFVDARETPVAATPIESLTDFHSAHGGTMASESEQSDAESIKASRMSLRQSYSSLSNQGRRVSLAKRASNVTPVAVVPIVPPPPPKPETKETSIQTDEWAPEPIMVPITVPPSPAKSFHRVGTLSNAPPFQFISSPTRAADTSFTSTGTATPTQVNVASATKAPGRESGSTFGGNLARVASPSRSARRESIESAFSLNGPEDPSAASPSRNGSAIISLPDRTKTPIMSIPPPPAAPPPSMPPPSFIPVNKKMVGTMGGIPPPRPTSPPPPELIQRATTPTFQRSTTPSLLVPIGGRAYPRQQGASLPGGAGLSAQPSTSSFRSAPNGHGLRSPINGVFDQHVGGRRDQSQASLIMSASSALASRRPSISSVGSSELHHPITQRTPGRPSMSGPPPPSTPPNNASDEGTDLDVIHAITQTMIGEFLYKYTRRVVGRGHGEKRHQRFFWIHPYTKTLYWSNADPGSTNVTESSAKSAYIDSVKEVLDPNPLPPGVHQYSIVVSTTQREMKFTAPTKERHDIWMRALKYLLERPATIPVNTPSPDHHLRPEPISPPGRKFSEDGGHGNYMTSPRSVRSHYSGQSYSITPRAMRSQTQLSSQGYVGKRPGTPADEYLRQYELQKSPTKSIRSYRQGANYRTDDEDFDNGDPAEESFVFNDEGFDAMENVRACCDGEHDLGTLSRRPGHHHHHHHHHQHQQQPPQQQGTLRGMSLSRPQTPADPRPTSPSGWSTRSKSGSTRSEGGSRLSQWANDAKRSIRFKSRGKSPAPRPSLNVPRSSDA